MRSEYHTPPAAGEGAASRKKFPAPVLLRAGKVARKRTSCVQVFFRGRGKGGVARRENRRCLLECAGVPSAGSQGGSSLCSRRGGIPMPGTWGAFFSGKEPAPHPGRKAPGRFVSPWTHNDTKGRACEPEHRRTARLPDAKRLATGVLPRKRLASSAAGGASPLSPLETPPKGCTAIRNHVFHREKYPFLRKGKQLLQFFESKPHR